MAKSTAPRPAEELTYENALAELKEIVIALEAETASLDQAMSLFERGQALVKRCTQLLEKAELKVKRLSRSELVDFEEE